MLKDMRLGLGMLLVAGCLWGCTQPGETTKVGAATGAGIGAGLGAIVGSATGDAAGGLVIGAVAGGGTGALVGNALESQQEAIKSQDEALERQEQLIRAQANEIQELRRLSQDGVTYSSVETITLPEDDRIRQLKLEAIRKGRVRGNPVVVAEGATGLAASAGINQGMDSASSAGRDSRASMGSSGGTRMAYGNVEQESPRYNLKDSTLVNKAPSKPNSATPSLRYESYSNPTEVEPQVPEAQVQERTASNSLEQIYAQPDEKGDIADDRMDSSGEEGVNLNAVSTNASSKSGSQLGQIEVTPECEKASQEITRANQSEDAADKLFHYRRALRYCPHNAAYHNGLGEVYMSLGRVEDARFEFEEALGVDGSFTEAKQNLQKLETKNGAVG